jgi:hypothetical protein
MQLAKPVARPAVPSRPIVAVRLDDASGTRQLGVLLVRVAEALERERPFGLLVASPAPIVPDASTRELLRPLRRRRAEIGTWCLGVAYVLPPAAAARFGRFDEITACCLWGCDVTAVGDMAAARAWLLARFDAARGRRPDGRRPGGARSTILESLRCRGGS